jgi:hypothetical protein
MHLQPAALDLELVERIPLRLNVDDLKVAGLPNLKWIIVHSVDALARMRSANHLGRCAWHADSQALETFAYTVSRVHSLFDQVSR